MLVPLFLPDSEQPEKGGSCGCEFCGLLQPVFNEKGMLQPRSHPSPYRGAHEKPAGILTTQNALGEMLQRDNCPLLQS